MDEPAPQPEAKVTESSDDPPQGDEEIIFYTEEEEGLEDELEEEEEEEELTLAELRKARTAARVVEEDNEEQGVIREEEQAPGSVPASPRHQPQGGEGAKEQEETIPVQEQLRHADVATSVQLPESGLTPEDPLERTEFTREHYEIFETLGLYNPEAPQAEFFEEQPQTLITTADASGLSQSLPKISPSNQADPTREPI